LSGEDIKIEYTPIKLLKIIDYMQLSLIELAKRVQTMMQLGQPILLNWAEGIAFYILPMSFDSDELVTKYLEGEVVLQSVVYAYMPNYSPIIKVKTFDVPVLNQTPNKVLRKVAKWLSKRTKKDEA
jgi:hypothetical protein